MSNVMRLFILEFIVQAFQNSEIFADLGVLHFKRVKAALNVI